MNIKYQKKKEKYLKEKRKCKCGCGKLIPWKDRYFTNRWPIYIKYHGKKGKSIPREVRECQCGCGQTFECKITSKKQYIQHHYCKTIKIQREKRECLCGCGQIFTCIITSNRKYIKNHNQKMLIEERECKCGCGQTFRCSTASKKQYIKHHQIQKILIEKRKCKCGCGGTFECKINSNQKYIKHHYSNVRRGKIFTKIYGKEKAEKIKNKMSISSKKVVKILRKGKTFEEIHGKEEAEKIKQKIRNTKKYKKGKTYEEIYGKKISKKLKKKLHFYSNKRKGKTYEEIHGKEKAKLIKKKISENKIDKWPISKIIENYLDLPNIKKSEWEIYQKQKILPCFNVVKIRFGSIDEFIEITGKPFLKSKLGSKGNDEKQILDYYENKLGNKIERSYKVDTQQGRYYLDGYDIKNKIPYEVDEPYHKYQIEKDNIRENNIISKLNCNAFVRFDQIKERKKFEFLN